MIWAENVHLLMTEFDHLEVPLYDVTRGYVKIMLTTKINLNFCWCNLLVHVVSIIIVRSD